MAIVAKYTGAKDADGAPLSYHGGIPARDLTEDDMDALSDEQKATLAHSAIYTLRGDAPKEAASAERRVERAEVAEAPKAESK